MTTATKQNTIFLYRRCRRPDVTGEFSSLPWLGDDTDGYDDGGREYQLPPGFYSAVSNGGTIEAYRDKDNLHCDIVNSDSGDRPALLICGGNGYDEIILEPVQQFACRA